jgi:protease I
MCHPDAGYAAHRVCRAVVPVPDHFMNEKPLRGVTVAVLVADGFEQIEVMRPIRTLKRAGAKIRVLSLRPGRLRGMNFIWRGRKVAVDELIAHADPEEYAALLLPATGRKC